MNLDRQIYHTNVTKGNYLHNTISTVIDQIAEDIKTTYGPYGSHSMIQTPMGSDSTKDGKTYLSSMLFDGTISSSIHKSVLGVSRKQVDEVGDGSTSTVLLLSDLYHGFRDILISKNIAPTILRNKVKNIVDVLKDRLKREATPITNDQMLYDTIYTSLDGEKDLADKLMEVLSKMNSKEPMILLEYSPTDEHRYDLIKGLEIDGTVIRPDIFFNGLSKKSFDDPYIIAVNGRVDLSVAILMELNEFTQKAGCDVVFLCTGISEQILENCVKMNQFSPGMFSRIAFFQMRMTSLNDEFMDICASLGANPIDGETLHKVEKFDHLKSIISASAGSCTKTTISEMDARFSEPKGNDKLIEDRIAEITNKIADLKNDPSSHNVRISDLESRKAFLSKNFAKFFVGGVSSQRKSINYELIADAVPQALSARKHGIVPGCNTIIPKIISNMLNDDSSTEFDEIDRAILEAIKISYLLLFEYILENKTGDLNQAKAQVVDHIFKNGFCPMNIRDENDVHEIFNSADTDRAILENATDMAVLLATTKSFISQKCEFDIINR